MLQKWSLSWHHLVVHYKNEVFDNIILWYIWHHLVIWYKNEVFHGIIWWYITKMKCLMTPSGDTYDIIWWYVAKVKSFMKWCGDTSEKWSVWWRRLTLSVHQWQLVNLIGNDSHRIFQCISLGPLVLSGPVAMLGGCTYAVYYLGPWALVGCAIFVGFYPFNVSKSGSLSLSLSLSLSPPPSPPLSLV